VLFPTFLLSGALFPIDQIPVWLRPFVTLGPLTYAVDALRVAILGTSHFALATDLGVRTAFPVAAVAVVHEPGVNAFAGNASGARGEVHLF